MANTLFTGKVYHRFSLLDSTNEYAQSLLSKNKPPEGTVVRADSQSAGRGQFGSRWESEPGMNLLLSLIFYPTWLPVGQQFYLSMAISLGLLDAVKRVLFPVSFSPQSLSLKWPNDLYLNGKKTAGILLQNGIQGHALSHSIIGIGLNVNQLRFDSALPNATSLALETGQIFDLDLIADALFEGIEARYLQLKAGQHADVKSQYEATLFRRGVAANYMKAVSKEVFEGIIQGVTASGLLMLETPNGVENFGLKDVQFLL